MLGLTAIQWHGFFLAIFGIAIVRLYDRIRSLRDTNLTLLKRIEALEKKSADNSLRAFSSQQFRP